MVDTLRRDLFFTLLRRSLLRCQINAFDFYARQFSSMANCSVIAFAPPVFKRDHLLVLAPFENFSRDFCPGDKRVAMGHVFSVRKHQHVAESRRLTRIDIEKIDIDRIAFSDAKLPATGSDDCVSHGSSREKKTPKIPQIAGLGKRKGRLRRVAAVCAVLSAFALSGFGLGCGFIRFANDFSIQRFIALRRDVPGKIARHCSFHQLGPEALVAED